LSKVGVIKHTLVHQSQFVNSTAKYPALIGGLGSGKTDGGIARTLKFKYAYPQLNTAYYMPDYNLIRDRGMSGFEKELSKINQPYKANYSDKIIKLENKGNIYFRTMDNPAKIVSYEVADSVIDELDTMKPDKAKSVYKKIRERNRQKKPDGKPNTLGIITTPDYGTEGFIWELYNKCIDKDTMDNSGNYELLNGGIVGNYHLIEACTADNPFLPKDYLSDILEMYDPILANLFTRGKMVSLTQDKVYHFYNKLHHNTLRVIKPQDRLHIGIDFNVGGCACVVHVVDGDVVSAVDEFAPKNTESIVIEINARYQGHIIYFYPDSSGNNESSNADRTDIAILCDGIRTPSPPSSCYQKANPSISSRVNAVNSRLSKNKYFVNCNKCPRTSNALTSQGWGKDGKPEKSKEHKGGAIDDFTDGLGYFIRYKFPILKSGVSKMPISFA